MTAAVQRSIRSALGDKGSRHSAALRKVSVERVKRDIGFITTSVDADRHLNACQCAVARLH